LAQDSNPEANKFGAMPENTDIQRENAEREIMGEIVQWKLKVQEVSKWDA